VAKTLFEKEWLLQRGGVFVKNRNDWKWWKWGGKIR
jgi:hypothetical protein